MRQKRFFSPEFKLQIIQELKEGASYRSLERKYDIDHSVFRDWKKKYDTFGKEGFYLNKIRRNKDGSVLDNPDNIIYFEVNDLLPGVFYPDDEPFITWMNHNVSAFLNDKFVKSNKLCVIAYEADDSIQYCVRANKSWILKNCPKLLTEYEQFLRIPDSNGFVYSDLGFPFLKYSQQNFGVHKAQ